MKEKIALILGSSGSVGMETLKVLLVQKEFQKVIAYVRKPFDSAVVPSSPKLSQKIIPTMNPATLTDAVRETLAEISKHHSEADLMAFSALGVGAGTAKLTIDQHRQIDVELNKAFAQALQKASQVKYFALLSAMGANPDARATGNGAAGMPRYARVKGEAEEAVKQHGPSCVGIFRPGIIRGSQHTPKLIDMMAPLIDGVIPKKYHSISTRQLALAMVGASLRNPTVSGSFGYPEMMEFIQ